MRLRLAVLLLVVVSVLGERSRADDFQISYAAGGRDDAGRFMGGTELRLLTPHGGRLYAGNGYWEDRPGAEGPQGAQILVLDAPGGRWRVDHAFDERMGNGRRATSPSGPCSKRILRPTEAVWRCPDGLRC